MIIRNKWIATYLPPVIIPIIAVLLALGIGGIFILLIGRNPLVVYWLLLKGISGSSYDIGQVLFKATPLIFTGLAVAFAFRAGMFNIGAEGQLYIGAFLTALCGGWIPAHFPMFPAVIIVPLCIIAGFLGGGIWGIIPGWLKSRFGVHEVIITIMLNFIAYGITNYLVLEAYTVAETVHTPEIGLAARITHLEQFLPFFKGSPVNLSLILALLCAAGCYWILQKTKLGYEIRAVGFNPKAAEYAGISVGKITVIAFFISGGLAGLVGVNFVQGYKYYFEDGFASGVGFMGIAVALLGQNHPVGVIFAALLFGALSQGGLAINSLVPKELVEILQAIVILTMVVMNEVLQRYLKKALKP